MNRRLMSLQVACVYIGTVVGAGFASGQEIYRFFARFGPIAYVSITLVTVLFAWLGYRMMALGAMLKATSFRDLNAYMYGPQLRKIIDIVLLLMLFGVTVAMLAGTGELFKEQLHIPFTVGVFVAVLVTFVTLLFGMDALLKVNSVIVPCLILFVIYTGAHTWLTIHPSIGNLIHPIGIATEFGVPTWLFGLLYAAMNIGLSVGVLVPLGGQIQDLQVLKQGAILGALGLGAMLMTVVFALFSYMPQAASYAIPMAFIASHFEPWLTGLFIAVLFGEIYSTLIGNVYALAVTVAMSRRQMLMGSACLLVLAAALSHFGFRAIVAYAYTGFGWISLFLIFTLTFYKLRLPAS